MMRKYFPLEASERLFVAIEEDDVVDAQVSLPPTIALSCTTEIIHDNYALCLQFWLNGVDRQELLRLVRKQAKGDELTADERKQFKYMRARYKHLRFAQRLYLKKHQAGFLFGKTTVFLGRFQDGFRNGKKNIVSYYGNLLRIYLSSPVWSLVNYSLRHSQLESVSGFIAYRQKQMHTLKEIIAKPRLTVLPVTKLCACTPGAKSMIISAIIKRDDIIAPVIAENAKSAALSAGEYRYPAPPVHHTTGGFPYHPPPCRRVYLPSGH